MDDGPDAVRNRCIAIVSTLNRTQHLELGEQECAALVADIQPLLQATDDNDTIHDLVLNYRAESATVAVLHDVTHPQHNQYWERWRNDVAAITRKKLGGWIGDCSSDGEDVLQFALMQMAESLPQYRYRSKLSTWTFSLVSQSVYSYLRLGRAKKREWSKTESLEAYLESGAQFVATDKFSADATVAGSELLALIDAVLGQRDDRMSVIMRLAVLEDQRLVDVGKRLNLSVGCISRLLKQARALLAQHPDLRCWLDDDEDSAIDEVES